MSQELEPIILTFGGGINAQRRPLDIEPTECVEGENFDLDPQVAIYRRRKPFDLAGTAPNGGEIRGYGQYIDRAGTTFTFIQAGSNVYRWDGAASFTLIGTVSNQAKLRGRREANDNLNQYLIVADLEKVETVKKWDGLVFQDLAHNLSGGFYAKFCHIHQERAWFANVRSGTDTPHVILASELGDSQSLTVVNRPSTSLSAADPFYLTTLDLRPINGIEQAFGQFFISSENGHLQNLAGSDATDFNFTSFYEGSQASGPESLVNIGNDVLIGAQGRIESLTGVIAFGDVETNDISLPIGNRIQNVTEWVIAYDRRLQKAFCFPDNQQCTWVYHKSLVNAQQGQTQISPWSKWTTTHSFGFQPSCVIPIKNPNTGLEAVYVGNSTGQIFLLDGAGDQDAGANDLTIYRKSGAFRIPFAESFDLEGYILYERVFAATVTLTFHWGGTVIKDQDISIKLPESADFGVYNGDYYYNDVTYYGTTFSGRLSLQDFRAAGLASLLQITVTVEGSADFEIHEIGIKLRAATR